jgi:hypothetical protein
MHCEPMSLTALILELADSSTFCSLEPVGLATILYSILVAFGFNVALIPGPAAGGVFGPVG